MNNTPPSAVTWFSPFEEPPSVTAHARDVAAHIDAEIIPAMRFLYDRDPWRKELKNFCDANGYRWSRVTRELRRLRFLDASTETPEVKCAGWINTELIEEMSGNLAPMCPFVNKGVSLFTFALSRWQNLCGSWCCATCGPDVAEAVHNHLVTCLKGLDEVFVAHTQWDSGLMNRMGQRRMRGANMFWYRRIDDEVFFISDHPIRGSKPPTSCEVMTAADALVVIREVMWVPGHLGHGWSAGWKPKSKPKVISEERDYLSLTGLSDEQIEDAIAEFNAEAQRRFGVRVDCGVIPNVVRDDLVGLLTEIVARIKGEADEAAQEEMLDSFDAFVDGLIPQDFGMPDLGGGPLPNGQP